MDSYQSRRDFSDQFLPEIKKLAGLAFFREATLAEDKMFATDLVVPNLRISVRIRRSKWLERYGNEFTLRNYAPANLSTEYQKLMQRQPGDPEFLIYAFVDDTNVLARVWLIDLTKWYYTVINNRVQPSHFRNKEGNEVISFPCVTDYATKILG